MAVLLKYYGLIYLTTTGQVVDELPLAVLPTWLQQINADGSWSVTTKVASAAQAGDPENTLLPKTYLRNITDTWRMSVAICFGSGGRVGDYICQAGPLTARRGSSEQDRTMQFGGAGLWGLLRMLMQIDSGSAVADEFVPGQDSTYDGTLRDIAIQILSNANARNAMPIDIPTVSGGGSDTRTYFGYDLVSAGQRLQELTQVENGPDVLLKPYFSDSGHIRHKALIGNPTLSTSGNPLVFDYPGSITTLLTAEDASAFRNTTYERGNGTAYTTLVAASVDPSLLGAGWPVVEVTDSNHTDVTEQDTLQQWADGQQSLYGEAIETWALSVKMDDEDSPFGTYDVGAPGLFNVVDHFWIEDGLYNKKILGMQGTGTPNQIQLLLQGSV